jgi:putative transposase
MVNKLLAHIDHALQINYLFMDGKFGNNNALQMTLQTDLHLISKLRCDSALYYRYDGPYSGKGRHRKYGDKVGHGSSNS